MRKCEYCHWPIREGTISISVSLCLGDPDNPFAQDKPEHWHVDCIKVDMNNFMTTDEKKRLTELIDSLAIVTK